MQQQKAVYDQQMFRMVCTDIFFKKLSGAAKEAPTTILPQEPRAAGVMTPACTCAQGSGHSRLDKTLDIVVRSGVHRTPSDIH